MKFYVNPEIRNTDFGVLILYKIILIVYNYLKAMNENIFFESVQRANGWCEFVLEKKRSAQEHSVKNRTGDFVIKSKREY